MTGKRALAPLAALGAALVAAVPAGGRPPTLVLPGDIVAEATSPAGAVVAYVATAHDNNDRPVPVSCAPPSGATFPLGETTVTCTARKGDDDDDDVATGRFKVTVRDTTPPVLSVPAEISVPVRVASVAAAHPPIATFLGAAKASDSVDAAPRVTNTAPDAFPVGRTVVTFSATDRFGNSASAASAVTVVRVRRAAAKRAALFSPAAGKRVSAPPVLAWRAVPRATFYNVQLFRRGQKILSRWPARPRLALRGSWRFKGRRFRLRPGLYQWWVWPAFGTPAAPRYGRALGHSTFRV